VTSGQCCHCTLMISLLAATQDVFVCVQHAHSWTLLWTRDHSWVLNICFLPLIAAQAVPSNRAVGGGNRRQLSARKGDSTGQADGHNTRVLCPACEYPLQMQDHTVLSRLECGGMSQWSIVPMQPRKPCSTVMALKRIATGSSTPMH
jgi:hypothetical protein